MRIIYVDVDTLRADHTTPYGYHRPTTPHLQALADKSVTFERYYCSDSPCLPSRTALTSGQFGITNGVIGHFGAAAQYRLDAGHGPEPDRPLLGQALGMGGYYTAAVSVFAERHRAYFFYGNFRESIRATDSRGDESAEDVNRAAIDWIRRHADEDNWYLHLTYWDPHTDYTQPVEWTEPMAASGPVQEWPDAATIGSHAEIYGPRSALDLHYGGLGDGRSPVPHNMPDAVASRADFEHLGYRVAARTANTPDSSSGNAGFRCAQRSWCPATRRSCRTPAGVAGRWCRSRTGTHRTCATPRRRPTP